MRTIGMENIDAHLLMIMIHPPNIRLVLKTFIWMVGVSRRRSISGFALTVTRITVEQTL